MLSYANNQSVGCISIKKYANSINIIGKFIIMKLFFQLTNTSHSFFFSLKIFALSLEIIFQLRRPQRPHDVSLFDPVFRTRHQHHQHQGESPPHQRAVIDNKYLGGDSHHSHRPTSQRSSLLFKEKDKSGEKLTKRMLVNEGLGR